MIKRLGERELRTKFGDFREVLYYDGQKESIALIMGDVAEKEAVLCRVHSHCTGAHVFNSIECDCREQMAAAQATIQETGAGVIIWLDQEAKGNGHLALIESIKYKKAGLSQADAYIKAGFQADARSYRAAAEILSDQKVKSIILLANGTDKAHDLEKESVIVAETRQLTVSP